MRFFFRSQTFSWPWKSSQTLGTMSVVQDWCVRRNSGVPQPCSYPDIDGGSAVLHDAHAAGFTKINHEQMTAVWHGQALWGDRGGFRWAGAEEELTDAVLGQVVPGRFRGLPACVVRWRGEGHRESGEKLGEERCGGGLEQPATCGNHGQLLLPAWHVQSGLWWGRIPSEYHPRGREGLSMEGLSCTSGRCRLILGMWPAPSALTAQYFPDLVGVPQYVSVV